MVDLAVWLMDKSELVICIRNSNKHPDTLVFAGWNNFLIDHFADTDLCQAKNWTIKASIASFLFLLAVRLPF